MLAQMSTPTQPPTAADNKQKHLQHATPHHQIPRRPRLGRDAARPVCSQGLHPRREMQLMVKVYNRPARKVVVMK